MNVFQNSAKFPEVWKLKIYILKLCSFNFYPPETAVFGDTQHIVYVQLKLKC